MYPEEPVYASRLAPPTLRILDYLKQGEPAPSGPLNLAAYRSFEVDVPPVELWYDADEGQITQIVWNLATNGIRAMPDGGRLRLVGSAETSSGGVIITVQDDGIGIAPEALDGLFQPFHGSFAKGSGLGLAIVHRIVTDYNGEIQVSSQPGSGTSVSVRLPARRPVATT